jgi:predicted ATPase
MITGKLHLRAIELDGDRMDSSAFPFSVPAVRTLPRIELRSAVTFLVGDNGSGKSTLLEGIAASARLPTVGGEEIERDSTLEAQRRLGSALRLTWTRRGVRGFFLRAEDFFGFARRIARMRTDLHERLVDIEREFAGASAYARGLAAGPVNGSLRELENRYGAGVDARSHGESFLNLFRSRLVPNGLYLLDEPEAALSPQSQLGFMAMMAESIADGSQFVIATHSPILLAYPGALILSFDDLPVAPVSYDGLEHVALTRDFLNDPDRFLRRVVTVEPIED